jgi:hypothetical protein
MSMSLLKASSSKIPVVETKGKLQVAHPCSRHSWEFGFLVGLQFSRLLENVVQERPWPLQLQRDSEMGASMSIVCQEREIFNDNEDHTRTIGMGPVVKSHVRESILKEAQWDDAPLVDLTKLAYKLWAVQEILPTGQLDLSKTIYCPCHAPRNGMG